MSKTMLFLALAVVALSACAPQQPITPSPTGPSASTPDTPTTVPSPTSTLTLTPTLPPTPTGTFTLVPSLTPTFPVSQEPSLVPTIGTPLTPSPGLVIRGHVRLPDGTGLPNVPICRNFASYAGTVVAVTGPDGYFQSDFAFIPGDEMVGVWPLDSGYNFDPPFVRWRHYHSTEDRTLDFVAYPTTSSAPPPGPCQ